MRCLINFCFLGFSLSFAICQSISPIGVCEVVVGRYLFSDSSSKSLYFTGSFSFMNNHDSLVDCVIEWNTNEWKALNDANNLPNFPTGNNAYSITRFKNELYIGGILGDFNNGKSYGMMKRKNNDWIPVKDSAFWGGNIYSLLSTDSLMYIIGIFDSIGGILSHNIASYDGINFHSFPHMGDNSGSLYAISLYKNILYVGGNTFFSNNNSPKKDILQWDGVAWATMGNGIPGLNSFVNGMLVYDNKLFVFGRMNKSEGDPGNGGAIWNGAFWTSADMWQNTGNGQIFSMQVYNGELYAVANYRYSLSDTFKTVLCKWNNNSWQDLISLGTNSQVSSMAVWNGNLYLGGTSINGGNQGVYVYNSITGMGKTELLEAPVVYPNPCSSTLILKNLPITPQKQCYLKVLDVEGNLIFSQPMSNPDYTLDMSYLPIGIYSILIDNGYKTYILKNIKK